MNLNKNNNKEFIKFSKMSVTTCLFLHSLLAWISLLILFVLLNIYFGDVLYCDGFNTSLDIAPESGLESQSNREDNFQAESGFSNTNGVYTSHGWHGFYKSYKDKVKRRLFWHLWKQDTNQFRDYKEFKESWNPNIKIGQEIKSDIKDELDKLARVKRTVAWFLNPRHRSNRRR